MLKKADKNKVDKRFEKWERPEFHMSSKFVKPESGGKELDNIKKMVGLN